MRKIESLHGVIRVERREIPPTVVYMMINDPKRGTVDKQQIEIEQYVRVAKLPQEVQEAIRARVRDAEDNTLEIQAHMHPDTWAEWRAELRAQAQAEEKP